MPGTTRHFRAHEFAAELRRLRERRDLSQREVARRAGLSTHALLSHWEGGGRLPSLEELAAVLDVLEPSTDERDQLLGMVREASSPGVISAGLPGTGPVLTELIGYESHARLITDVSPLVIPGLLQTTGYARAIFGSEPSTETRVALRAGRRDILTRHNPVDFVAFIDSEVLVRPVAPHEVMREQLRYLLDMAQRKNITLQLLSSTRVGWHPGLSGPFELIEFPKAGPIVLLEHHRSSMFLWKPDDVREFVAAVDDIRKAAMSPAESVEAIAFILNGSET